MPARTLTASSSIDELADAVSIVDGDLAEGMRTANPMVTVVLDHEEQQGRSSAAVIAFTIEWVTESRTGRALSLGATVIQTARTWFSEDGSGEQWQYVARGVLTADEVRTVASLIANGLLPERASWEEN